MTGLTKDTTQDIICLSIPVATLYIMSESFIFFLSKTPRLAACRSEQTVINTFPGTLKLIRLGNFVRFKHFTDSASLWSDVDCSGYSSNGLRHTPEIEHGGHTLQARQDVLFHKKSEGWLQQQRDVSHKVMLSVCAIENAVHPKGGFGTSRRDFSPPKLSRWHMLQS